MAAGDGEALCEFVASSYAARSDVGDLPEVAALVSALPDAILAGNPAVLLELARACGDEARVRLRARLMEHAARLPVADLSFGLALEAERIVTLATNTQADEVERRHEELLARLDAADGSRLVNEARARSCHALGRVLTWRGDPVSLSRAEDALHVAAGLARGLGRNDWRAGSLLTLGYGVHFLRGEETRGADLLREAMALLPTGHPRRAGIGTFLAESLVRSHRGEDALALLAEIRGAAAATGDQRSLGYAAWILAVYYAERGDRTATVEWIAEAERHPGDWFEHSTGSEFLAEAAICAERVGAAALADEFAARAVARAERDGYPESSWLATGMIEARRGDPARAVEVLTALLAEAWFPARDAWSVWLHLALARLRAGDESGAVRDAVRGLDAAASLVGPGRAAATVAELPAVVTRLEPDLVRRLGPLAAAHGSSLAAALQPPTLRIRLFGGLAVTAGEVPVAVPAGKPAQLLILLAVVRRPVPIDLAIEELWPEVAADVGRRRLRNVLARLRAACGDVVVRAGETLCLADDAQVDVAEFERAAEAARRAGPADRSAAAQAALARFGAPLVPEAAYAPRVVQLQDQLAQRAIELWTVLADDAAAAGDTDAAVRAMERIVELDPYDDIARQRGVHLLRAAGRPDAAAGWAERMRRFGDE